MEVHLPDLDDMYQGVVSIKEAHSLLKKGGLTQSEFKQIKKSTLFKMVYKTPAQTDLEDEEDEMEEINKELARKNL